MCGVGRDLACGGYGGLGREGKVRPEEGVGWGVGVVAEVVADVAVLAWGMWGRGE